MMPPPGPETATLKQSVLRGKMGAGQSWELHATDIKYDDMKKAAVATDIDCTFFGKQNQRVRMQAKAANVNLQNEDVDFVGRVVAKANSGEVLTIERLRWDGKVQKFYGTEGVKLTRGKSWMTGKEMIGDAAMQRLEIKGDVQIYLDDIKDANMGKATH